MPASPTSVSEFWELLRKSAILAEEQCCSLQHQLIDSSEPQAVAEELVRMGILTHFQARQLLAGRYKGFRIGQYVVQDIIGRGGMGAVYLAEHIELRRKVAVKVLVPAQGEDQRLALERFIREARAAAALDHPNIVRIFDVARHNNVPYLIMEYVDGETLQQVLEREGALPYEVAVEYIAQAAAGLQHAHERGFVHRDIKPSNLMRDKQGIIKILDMGLARSNNQNDHLTERLDKGAVVGTADFISPEQALNQPNIDGRADIYSLGATLFALIIGKPPFEGNTTQKLLQHQLRSAPRLSSLDQRIPKELCDVVARMLAKRPEDRYQTAADVIAALAPWTAGSTRVLAAISHTKIGQEADVAVNLSSNQLNGSSIRLGELSHHRLALKETPRTSPSAMRTTAPLSGVYHHPTSIAAEISAVVPREGGFTVQPVSSSAARGSLLRRPWIWVSGAAALLLVLASLTTFYLVGSRSPTNAEALLASQSQEPTPQPAVIQPQDQNTPPPQPTSRPQAGRVLYEWKASTIPPFRVRLKGGQVVSGQRPQLPQGIAIYALKPETDAEFFRETRDGRDCVTIVRHSAAIGAQIALELERDANQGGLGLQMSPSGKYALRIDYQTAAQIASSVHTIQGYRSAAFRIFPASADRWATVDLPFSRENSPLRCAIEAVGTVGVPVSIAAVRLVELEAPPSSWEPRIVYQLDLQQLQPFRVVAGSQQDPQIPNQRHYREILREGEVPTGWRARTWREETEMEFTLVRHEGQPALSFRNLKGRGSAMIFMPPFKCPSGHCRLLMEFKTTTAPRRFHIRFRPNDNRPAWDVFTPTPIQDTWQSLDIAADLRGATGGFFEFHNSDDNTNAVTLIRALKIIELPSVLQNEAVLFRLNAADLPEFKNTKQGRSIVSGDEDPVIPGVYFSGWKPETVSEYTCGVVAGSKAIGITNVNEIISAQIGIELERAVGAHLRPGQQVHLRVEYRTANQGQGRIYFQTYDDWKVLFHTDLPTSNDRWSTVDLIAIRGEKPLRCLIDTRAAGRGNILFVRSITITAAKPGNTSLSPNTPPSNSTPPSVSPPAAQGTKDDPTAWAEGRVVYRLDVSSIAPFRVVKEQHERISGEPEKLPVGVGCQCWKQGSVGEFRRATVDDVPALGLTGLNDVISAQLYFNLEGEMKLTLEPNKMYKVKITYLTHNDARGQAIVHVVPGYSWIANVSLNNTNNRWQTATLIFRRPSAAENAQVRLVIDNATVGEGNTLWVRSVEIVELVPPQP